MLNYRAIDNGGYAVCLIIRVSPEKGTQETQAFVEVWRILRTPGLGETLPQSHWPLSELELSTPVIQTSFSPSSGLSL